MSSSLPVSKPDDPKVHIKSTNFLFAPSGGGILSRLFSDVKRMLWSDPFVVWERNHPNTILSMHDPDFVTMFGGRSFDQL